MTNDNIKTTHKLIQFQLLQGRIDFVVDRGRVEGKGGEGTASKQGGGSKGVVGIGGTETGRLISFVLHLHPHVVLRHVGRGRLYQGAQILSGPNRIPRPVDRRSNAMIAAKRTIFQSRLGPPSGRHGSRSAGHRRVIVGRCGLPFLFVQQSLFLPPH